MNGIIENISVTLNQHSSDIQKNSGNILQNLNDIIDISGDVTNINIQLGHTLEVVSEHGNQVILQTCRGVEMYPLALLESPLNLFPLKPVSN